MEPLDDQAIGTQDLTPMAKTALLGARPWMMFLAILGFIYVALNALGVFTGFASGEFGSAIISLIMTAFLGYFYWLLFRSAQGIKQFGLDGSATTLEDTLKHYKTYWMISGILTIIIIAFAVIGIFAALLMGMSGSGM